MELPSDYVSGYAAMDREHIGRGRREASLDLSPHHFFPSQGSINSEERSSGGFISGKEMENNNYDAGSG